MSPVFSRFDRRHLLAVVGLLGVIAAAVVWLASGDGASAHENGRGAPMALQSAKPAALDRSAVQGNLAALRSAVHRPAVSASPCLDRAAAGLAASFAAGQVPTTAPGTCGSLAWGWVAGTDASGVQMSKALGMRDGGHATPLVDPANRHIGLALGERRTAGVLTGYVLVWVAAR